MVSKACLEFSVSQETHRGVFISRDRMRYVTNQCMRGQPRVPATSMLKTMPTSDPRANATAVMECRAAGKNPRTSAVCVAKYRKTPERSNE